ncbi:porin [Geobacter sp. AOG2]|uniref:porin n=1 Tax=Geobacter sp. AOG2 TaxID=1566347 RepID=UPI001CC3F539|nr:porin [Geobacter sp. AOG2]GFE61658.1 hypothetical protein AOG2_22450 [Geobacter sp. AOG2]
MKKLGILLGLALLVAQAGSVSAKSLEDVLKEKGVITEEDYKEIQKSSQIKYKPGGGLNFATADGKFGISIGASYQVRYTFLDGDDVNKPATDPDYSKFELRRIKLLFNGHAYSPDLTYKMNINFANFNSGSTANNGPMEEVWLNYRLMNEVQFRLGQDKVQFGRQWITSSTAQQFVDASIVTSAFVPGYDTGAMIHGKIAGGIFNYNIAGYGGVGQNTWRSKTDNAFSARLTANPLGEVKYSESDVEYSKKPLVSIGADYFRDTLSNTAGTTGTLETNQLSFLKSSGGWYGVGKGTSKFTTGEKIDFNTCGADAVFKWLGFSATGEYFFAQAEGQTSGKKMRAQGFYAQAGYFVIPKTLELAYRYSYLDPDRDASRNLWTENAVGASWYVNSTHNLKVQADYTNIHKQAGLISTTAGTQPTDDNQVRFQVQMVF